MDPAALFDAFVAAPSFSKILQSFSQMCTILNIDQCESFSIYRRLKEEIKDWKAEKLWALLDKRAAHKEYCHQKACERLNVLVIGAGPCGLRSAIECALLGSRVILVEQRDRFSRNNVLHIWPFVIQDLKDLGIKIFYPKFCRGSIDHISIRQLQCALLKVALVLGVQVHESVGFKRLIFPKADKSGNVRGWRAEFIPSEHFLSEYEFDVLIGADGKRNTVPGFPKREMRGKLAIGITANFVNKKTIEEEKVQEISGVAYIFNQQFFKEMKEATGIDLENIVYYKDETHYFVMCVKKQSLLDKGVILEDSEDVAALLAPSNVDQEKLCLLAAEAADFATAGKLPKLVYAQNHNGENDVAMFDFTSLFSAECSVRLGERCDRRLLMTIVGDTLHEPFWPTGSGCARGFLGVFDAAWMIRSYGLNKQGTMALLAERESIYRLLGQATSDNLQKQVHKYTIDPRTRYVSFEVSVEPYEISHLIDTDNPRNVEVDKALPLAHKTSVHDQNTPFISRYRLLRFCQRTLYPFKLKMYDFKTCWEDGRALSAIVARYRPDLLDYLALLSSNDSNSMFLETVNIIKNELGLEPVCDGLSEWQHLDEDKRVFYLHALMNILLSDIDRIRSVLVPSVKSTSTIHKRKFDASRSKKSDPIKQRTASLLDSFAATHNVPVCSADESSTAKCNEQFSSFLHISKQIASKVHEVERCDELNFPASQSLEERHIRRLQELDAPEDFKKFSNQTFLNQSDSNETSSFTKRPLVEKLNPERLYIIERIVTGEDEKAKAKELYRNKRRQASISIRKMDPKDLNEMETKLEQTGMGVLFDKNQYRVLTSKEEKILAANAAAARQVVKDGFVHDNSKYKDVDERICKADCILRNKNLSGVDVVSRFLDEKGESAKRALNTSSSSLTAKVPPPPPKKKLSPSFSVQKYPTSNGVVIRQGESSSPARRPVSIAVANLSYDSVNARRQVFCQLCGSVVYLAERMQVEGFFIHKRCFRCSYCSQPLRLGNATQDRNMHEYNPRFYCSQHINVPTSEKIARLKKLETVQPKNPSFVENSKSIEIASPRRQTAPVVMDSARHKSGFRELNSPQALLGKTIEKMRARRDAISLPLSEASTSTAYTPERAEFETFKNGTEHSPPVLNKKIILSSSEKQETERSSSSQSESTTSGDEATDESSSSSDEEFMEAELAELEKTISNNIDQSFNDTISEDQAINLIKSFNERRKSATPNRRESPSSVNETPFHTPPTSLSQRLFISSEKSNPDSIPCNGHLIVSVTPKSVPKSDKINDTLDVESIRQRMLNNVEDLREKARLRAKMKSDEELGLIGGRSSTSNVTGDSLRLTRHASLQLTSHRLSPESERIAQAIKNSPVLETPNSWRRGFSVGNEEEKCEITKCVSFRSPKSHSPVKADGGLLSRLFPIDFKVTSRKQNSFNQSESSERSCPQQRSSLVQTKEDSNSSSLDDRLHLRQGSSRQDVHVSSHSHLSELPLSDRMVRRVQKRATQIARHKEQDRIRTAQDIERSLQEAEIRKSEVISVGEDLELRLQEDSENRWILEQWLVYVHELEQIEKLETHLKLRLRELKIIDEYKRLHNCLKLLQEDESVISREGSSMNEKDVLKEILRVIDERDAIRKEIALSNKSSDETPFSALDSLQEKQKKANSYYCYKPVFLKS